MEQQDLQKRLTLALVLSLLVFVGYGYLFPVPKPTLKTTQIETNQTKTHTLATNQAPTVTTTNDNSAPIVTNSNKPSTTLAPVSSFRVLASVVSTNFIYSIDEYGRIGQVELLESKFRDDKGNNLKMLSPSEVRPLEIRFSDVKLNEEAFKTPYIVKSGSEKIDLTNGEQKLVLEQTLSTVVVTKEIIFKPTGEYSITVKTSIPTPYFITPGHRPVADQSMYMLVRGVLIKGADGIINTIEDGDAEGYETYKQAKIASSFDRYVASIFFDFNKGIDVSIIKEANGDPLIFVQGNENFTIGGYIGEKDEKTLRAINPELTDAIEFGWFSFLAKPFFVVLLWINDYVGNWGWAIILFTLLVKLILFPLSYKGMMSMQKLKDLAPKMKEIKEKYKGDPAKMNVQMMDMYKKHGANPMGGCLPLILQIPVFFALYRVLLNAVELQGAEWILWIEDLAVMDPYFVLPILMGASMFFQQKITPTNFTDPLQEKIFKFFPVIMTVFFIYFPSGLVLYWLVNNLFTIAQQYFINYMYAKHKEEAIELHKKVKDNK
ncbi:MAG: membrane protein insertase YidC [Sulfurovum sp.]